MTTSLIGICCQTASRAGPAQPTRQIGGRPGNKSRGWGVVGKEG
jgi:hypothetical protein